MNRVAVVTGASGGIGAAICLCLARDGYDIAVHYQRNLTRAEALCEQLRAEGVQALPFEADFASEEEIVALFGGVAKRMGRIDVLVNNAGILRQQMSLVSMSAERIREVLDINVVAPMICCREASAYLKRGSCIVNISSVAATLGAPNEYVDYAASKAAIDAMTVGLAKELAPQGIRVVGIRPGVINTDIHASGGEPNRPGRVAKSVPLQRAGEPMEVAQLAAWLVSDAASYITGTSIDVSGGR
ncbi:MAG: SDR family oxidoreductase [Gammaproteobacteria bacterium]|nr:SDR family oxidoreductase [Gammaproteobacteria bacterium]